MVRLIYGSNSLQWICLCWSEEPSVWEGEQAVISTRAGGDSSRGTAITTVFPTVKTRYTTTQSRLEIVIVDLKNSYNICHLCHLQSHSHMCSPPTVNQWQDAHELKNSATSQAALLTTGVYSMTYNPSSSLEPALPSSIMDPGHRKSNQRKGFSEKSR